ncbi:MAG TPA: FCD domain-containing protein [Acidimicrobiales bacterium]|nr:FCD domain-containing protein [Acidimicrobiales bacterium]
MSNVSAGFRFRPIRGFRVFEEVVDQLTYAIRSGAYDEGDWLPTLDELSLQMQTSRPSIGEAVRLLVSAGVLETKRGMSGGIVVRNSAIPSSVLGLSRPPFPQSVQDLVEARRPVELALAQLAGQRATEDDFAAIGRTIDMLPPARGNPSEWVRANVLFHYGVAKAARSETLAMYSHEIMEQLAILLDSFDERFVAYEHTLWVHNETLAALRSRDPTRIATIMDDHLRELEVTTAGCTAAGPAQSPVARRDLAVATRRRVEQTRPARGIARRTDGGRAGTS